MTDFTYSRPCASSGSVLLTVISAMAKTAGETLHLWWHNYRTRRELASLSYFERSDLPRNASIDAEIAKPFWKK